MKKTLLFILAIFCIVKVNSQGLICNASEENEKIYLANPISLLEKKEFDAFSKTYALNLKNGNIKKAPTNYIIPVVFHIYGQTHSGMSVTYEKIVNHLEKLNDDFNGRNHDYETVDPFFKNRRDKLNIEFKLAKRDPDGNATTGVDFHPSKGGYGNGWGYDDAIKADAWDNKKYMNIYIQNDLYNNGVYNNSGVAWYPNSYMTANNTARVVYNGAYLYDNSYSTEFSSVLTHEFGHFFNLFHTFEGGCYGSDEVDDTPEEDGQHLLSCTPGTNCNGNKVNIENYMGYNGSRGCYKMYTQGQVARMMAAMQHPARITLWQPQNLIDTGVNLGLGVKDINNMNLYNIYPNPTSDIVNFTFNKSINIPKVEIKIYTAAGTLVIHSKKTTSLSVKELPSGVYFVVFTDGTFVENTKLIIK